MTRFPGAAVISLCVTFFTAFSGFAQSDRDSSSDSRCFPWQEFRDGHCVSKPSQPAPSLASPLPQPVPTPVVSDPCINGARNLSTQCACPENTHRDAAGGACLADVQQPAPKANASTMVCDGGTLPATPAPAPPGST